ncbi:YebC/PmpR family DNA-binding transcriptional regulator [Lactiplantibacillus daoliensis]|uniref:Probable transcriptional regulatory protein ACFQH1_05535 n=1 Tax=Lactiplantibacillus daoliensis TaxID=2559916 RepID=A0ABW1UFJ9_9LACO|nr:YebC/PmpR family DNA-binding transcriptional regulator [Lactiplantibacillus daoliensis]
MSGHSKWHNIQGRKNAQDAKRGKIFQKISRELFMAVKAGGPDPDSNSNLRLIMDKAKAANMPKDNIKRAVAKGSGSDAANYEEVTYEGYGPGGIAVLVHALTDNKNRTAAAVRSAFTHHGGALAATGAVSYMFDRKGYIVIQRTDDMDTDEDTMLMDVLDAGGDDLQSSDEAFEIYTDPKQLAQVRDALEAKGYNLESAELTMIPETLTDVPEDKLEKLQHMLEELEDNDDVADVYEAANFPDED